MSLPQPANTTCDVYRSGNLPPAAPDVAGVSIYLEADFERRQGTGEALAAAFRYTHVALADLGADVRDGNYGATPFVSPDTVWVPDRNGTRFNVVFVERSSYEATAHKRVYLDRKQPTWPTNEL